MFCSLHEPAVAEVHASGKMQGLLQAQYISKLFGTAWLMIVLSTCSQMSIGRGGGERGVSVLSEEHPVACGGFGCGRCKQISSLKEQHACRKECMLICKICSGCKDYLPRSGCANVSWKSNNWSTDSKIDFGRLPHLFIVESRSKIIPVSHDTERILRQTVHFG